MLKPVYILFFAIIFASTLFAQTENLIANEYLFTPNKDQSLYRINENEFFLYEKPTPYQFLVNAPFDIYDYTKETFSPSNWKNLVGLTVLTSMLVVIDQDIIDVSQQQGRNIGIDGSNNIKTVVKYKNEPVMQLPTDLSSGLYFIGDGWTHVTITTSFFAYGMFTSDTRALQTASQLAEGLAGVTFVTQLLKHITGRQSPYRSTQSRGKWDLFPNQEDYHQNVPAYDAFPSGHLAAAMMAVTVISENYKEYKYIKPLGYTLMTILGYQMLNNGVHWASDYPLALAMGYSFGKLVVSRNRKVIDNNPQSGYHLSSYSVNPGLLNGNAIGLTAKLYFN
jgi:hypothetical protein